jgi:RNA recognition motif-containing protein
MNIHVGNLSTSVDEIQLRDLFTPYGKITKVNILMDFGTRRSKGFGFVEMENRSEGQSAINRLHNTTFMENVLEVNEARPGTSTAPRQQFSYRDMEKVDLRKKK